MTATITRARNLAGTQVYCIENDPEQPLRLEGPAIKALAVILTAEEFEALRARAEDAEDAALARHLAATTNPDDYLPVAAVERLYTGEHPLRVWREVRGMSLSELSRAVDIVPSYISAIETKKKPGSVETLQKLARALRVSIEDLVPDAEMTHEEDA